MVETKHVHARNIEKIKIFIQTMPSVTLEQALQFKGWFLHRKIESLEQKVHAGSQIGHKLQDPIFKSSSLVDPMSFVGNRLIPTRIHPSLDPALFLQQCLKVREASVTSLFFGDSKGSICRSTELLGRREDLRNLSMASCTSIWIIGKIGRQVFSPSSAN